MRRESSEKVHESGIMQISDLEEAIAQLVIVNSVLWCGHVVRKDKNNVVRKSIDVVQGTGKSSKPKKVDTNNGKIE